MPDLAPLTPGMLPQAVADRIASLNESALLSAPIEPAAHGPLSALPVATALEVLAGLVESAVDCDNPTEWVVVAAIAVAEQLQQGTWVGATDDEPPRKSRRTGDFGPADEPGGPGGGAVPTTPDMEAVPRTPDREEEEEEEEGAGGEDGEEEFADGAAPMTPPLDDCPRTPDRDDDADGAAGQSAGVRGPAGVPQTGVVAAAMRQTRAAQLTARVAMLGKIRAQTARPGAAPMPRPGMRPPMPRPGARPPMFRPGAAPMIRPGMAPIRPGMAPTSRPGAAAMLAAMRPRMPMPAAMRPGTAARPPFVRPGMPFFAAARPAAARPAAARPAAAPSAGVFKSAVCRLFEAGNCPRGAMCTFAHTEEEREKAMEFQLSKLNEALDKYKTVLCRAYAEGKCVRGENCTFAHGAAELQVKS